MLRASPLFFLILSGAAFVTAIPARAQIAPVPVSAPTDDPARRLLDEERERQRRERLTREAPRIDVETPAQDDGRPPADYPEVEPAFAIREITVQGNTVLPVDELEAVFTPFRGVPLGINRINLLLRRLTARYLEKGYFTTRVYLGEQNLREGRLVIEVFEGRLENLRYNGAPPPPGVRFAFPVADGDILRLQDIEQGIEQLNRLRRNRATLTVQPGERPGGSIVDIRNEAGDARYYSAGIDNAGQRASGQTRLRLGFDLEDALGLQESLSLGYTGASSTNAMLLNASIPFGYQTFTYTLSYSDYVTWLGGYALMFGDTLWHNLAWNLIFERGQHGRDGLDVALGYRQAQRQINDAALTPQRLTTLRVAASRYRIQPWGTWLGELACTQGIGLFGADNDHPGQPGDAPAARFRKLTASADITLDLSENWRWRSNASGQWAWSGLYGAEQFFLGGSSTVRGFDESSTAGDRGILLRNDLTWNAGNVLADSLAPIGLRAQPYLFLDAGHTRLLAAAGGDTLAGAGFGARLGGKNLSGDISLGWPLQKPAANESSGARLAFALTLHY